jgi:ligand-binding sensor domain-containing protein
MKKLILLLLSGFAGALFGQNPTWEHFYPDKNANSVAARGNDILVCANGDRGFAHFDTLGNITLYDAVNSGLPFNDVSQVAIDPAGNWWFGYSNGVSRYDGVNWTNWETTPLGINFSYSNLSAIKTAPDGRVGVCTGQGALVFDGGNWTLLTNTNSGLPSNLVRDMAFGPGGEIYFATSMGLAVLDGTTWTVFNTTTTGITGFGDCKSVALTSSGTVWVTIGSNRFARFDNGAWTALLPSNIGLTGAGVSGKVITDAQDRVWMSFSKSISVLNDTTWTHYTDSAVGCTLQPALIGFRMAVDGAGQLWTTACGGLKFDGQNWEPQNLANSALPFTTYVITQDTAGDMWFAGMGAENYRIIARKQDDNWDAFNPFELGTNDTITEIFAAHGDTRGNVWFGMITGEVLRYDGANWHLIDTIVKKYPNIADIWTIHSGPGGDVWFACLLNGSPSGSLARYQDGAWTFFEAPNIPLPANRFIKSMAFDAGGRGWFLSSDGGTLLQYDGGNWSLVDLSANGLPATAFNRRVAAAPDGALWLASDAGLARLEGNNWTTLTTANPGPPSDNITHVAFDRAGGMYIGFEPVGTSANVAVFRGGEWSLLVPTGIEPGFFNEPFDVFVDRNNRLWFNGFQEPSVFVYDPMLVETLEPEAPDGQITVFPNPVSDMLRLHLPGWTAQRAPLHITDARGRSLYRSSIEISAETATFRVPAEWPAGIYFLETADGQGRRLKGRFVKL